jgi:hypothetical protein
MQSAIAKRLQSDCKAIVVAKRLQSGCKAIAKPLPFAVHCSPLQYGDFFNYTNLYGATVCDTPMGVSQTDV